MKVGISGSTLVVRCFGNKKSLLKNPSTCLWTLNKLIKVHHLIKTQYHQKHSPNDWKMLCSFSSVDYNVNFKVRVFQITCKAERSISSPMFFLFSLCSVPLPKVVHEECVCWCDSSLKRRDLTSPSLLPLVWCRLRWWLSEDTDFSEHLWSSSDTVQKEHRVSEFVMCALWLRNSSNLCFQLSSVKPGKYLSYRRVENFV